MALTLRPTEFQESLIEDIKKSTAQTTASGAIFQALEEYLSLRADAKKIRAELRDLYSIIDLIAYRAKLIKETDQLGSDLAVRVQEIMNKKI